MSPSRTLILENLPPVVRITFENGVITLTAQNSESAPPSPSREAPSPSLRVGQVWRRRDGQTVTVVELMPSGRARCNYFTDDACLVEYYVGPYDLVELLQDVSAPVVDEPSQVAVVNPTPAPPPSEVPSFQIAGPGRYRLRDGQEVDLLPLPLRNSHYENGFRWYGIIPSESQTWTTNGSWWGRASLQDPSDHDDWDVVAGPLPPPENPPSDKLSSEPEEEDVYPGPVPCVPPVVGRRFRMRNGKTVIVTKQDTDDWYPFDNCDAGKEPWKSLRIESDEKFARCWTAEGHHDLDESKQPYVSGYDLVEDLGSVIPRVPESTSSSAQEPFQIKEPGWYRFRNGTLVELRARTPNDRDRSWDHAYSWFAVNPVRDLTHSYQPVQTQGYDLANVLRHPWWRTDGSYLDISHSSKLWCDIVSGPFPAPVPEPVRTFPSWLHRNFNFVARDEDGTWYAYGYRPERADDQWDPQEDDEFMQRLWDDLVDLSSLPFIVPDVPWHESLIERPNSEPSITS